MSAGASRAWSDHPGVGRPALSVVGDVVCTHYDSFCVQLGRWTREGLLEKIANATYKLTPECLPAQPSPTDSLRP